MATFLSNREWSSLSMARRSTQQGSPATIGSTLWYRQKPSSRLRSGGSSLKNTLYPFFIYVWGFASPVSPQPATLGKSGMTQITSHSESEGTRIFFVNSRRPLDEPSVPVSKSHNSPDAVFGGLLSKPVSIVSCGTHPRVVLTVSRFGAL